MKRLRTGDDVIVTTGRDRGRRGTLTAIRADGRVIVEGANMVKKHQRPNPNAGIQGGIIEIEAPIQPSNVMLYNPKTEKGDKVSFREIDGRKQRVYRSTGDVVGN